MYFALLHHAPHTPLESSPLLSQCRYVANARASGRFNAPSAPTNNCACALWLFLTASVNIFFTSSRPGISANFIFLCRGFMVPNPVQGGHLVYMLQNVPLCLVEFFLTALHGLTGSLKCLF